MLKEVTTVLAVLIAWAVIYLIWSLLRDRISEKVSVGAFYIYVKTQRLNMLFNEFTDRNRGGIEKILLVGEIVCFAAMIYSLYLLSSGVYRSVVLRTAAPTVVPILPGITVSLETFAKMLPAIVAAVFLHEFSHKIAFRTNGLDIKSMGVGLFLLFPFAFVEPDEEKFKRSKPSLRMRVLAAGSFINLVTAAIFAPFIYYPPVYETLLQPFYGPPSGIIVVGIGERSPLTNFTDIEVGDVIIGIDNVTIHSMEDLNRLNLQPGQEVTIHYYKKVDLEMGEPKLYSDRLVTAESPLNSSKGIIGIMSYPRELWPLMTYYPPKLRNLTPYLPATLFEVLMWIFALSFSIGVINMLPLYPLDGYGFFESLLDKFRLREKTKKLALYATSAISLALLASNFIIPLIGA